MALYQPGVQPPWMLKLPSGRRVPAAAAVEVLPLLASGFRTTAPSLPLSGAPLSSRRPSTEWRLSPHPAATKANDRATPASRQRGMRAQLGDIESPVHAATSQRGHELAN